MPLELESGSVPLNDGFGKHEDERLLPVGPDLPCDDPEQFVEQTEPWFRMSALEHCESLSQDKIFQHEAATSEKETSNGAETEIEGVEHASRVTRGREGAAGPKPLISKPSKVLANDRQRPKPHGHTSDQVV